MSAHDAITDFMKFMEDAGVKPIEPIAQRLMSGQLIRFRCEGDSKGRQNGWAMIHLDDRPAGAFGNYRMNTGTLKWRSGSDGAALSLAEREALNREWRQARERREAEKRNTERQAAIAAGDIWRNASSAQSSHPYAFKKMIATGPLKQMGDELLIPMFAADGFLWNLQRIKPCGEKRFLKGGRVEDLFCIVGTVTPDTKQVVFTEGYSTGDAVALALKLPVVVAFSSANMIRVARLWASLRPDIEYTVYGDDDAATETKIGKNPGREAAIAAAHAIGAKLAFPTVRAA